MYDYCTTVGHDIVMVYSIGKQVTSVGGACADRCDTATSSSLPDIVKP